MTWPAPLLLLALLVAPGCSDPAPEAAASAPLAAPAAAPLEAPHADAGKLVQENAELRAELEAAQLKNASLREELAAEQNARIEREQQWLHFTQGLGQLSKSVGIEPPVFPTPLVSPESPAPAPPAPPDPTLAERVQRSRQVFLRLRALFEIEEISGLDLLESGQLEYGSTGPVVLRTLDANGRPTGVLCADHLRLEASKAARTLTLVLEQGFERRGGQRFPFSLAGEEPHAAAPDVHESALRQGTKRIRLPHVDPTHWIESLPELFRAGSTVVEVDDGKHDLAGLRVALNQLLREDAAGGWWRLSGLGGVQQGVLRDVQLDGLDREGRLERVLFADRLEIRAQTQGVLLVLQDGAQLRGDRKTPFLEGGYRILLPRAVSEAWRKAGLPLIELPLAKPDEPGAAGEAPAAKQD